MIDFATQRNEICRVARSLFERGYVHSTAGNISMRVSDGFLITPTDASLGFLHAEQLAHTDPSCHRISGPAPSKTLALHRSIYKADSAVRCVIHTHSTELVALSLAGAWRAEDVLPPITPYYVMKVGHVPLIPYRRPGDPAAAELVAAQVREALERGVPIHGVLLERLGPVVWHETPAAAMAVLEELEETARLWRISQPRPEPLSEAQIEELRGSFGARW